MAEPVEMPKPKRERKPKEAIIVAPPEPDVRLGSLAVTNSAEGLRMAVEIATTLAEIINTKHLFTVINKRKYVWCEGWTTMGFLLGVTPEEDYCRQLPDGKGYEAKVNLIRVRDSGRVGSASAECTYSEEKWKNKDSYQLRSMALTRATSKAFRLSFSWVMKLAGFMPTPAEEMMGLAEQEAKEFVEEEVERQKRGETPQEAPNAQQKPNGAAPTLFISWPRAQQGKNAFVTGLVAIKLYGLKSYIERDAKGIWLSGDQGFMVPSEHVSELRRVAEGLQCPIHEQDAAKAK